MKEDAMFGPEDAQMLDHIVDVIGDRVRGEDGYTEADNETLKRLERLRDTCRTESLICVVMVGVTAAMVSVQAGGEAVDDDETECRDRDGKAYPEHDFDEFQCRRCGAEPAEAPTTL